MARKKWKSKYPRKGEELQPSNIKTYKHMGYCPACKLSICDGDLEEGKKSILLCPACGWRGNVSKVLKEKGDTEFKPKTKKEFLEEVPDHSHLIEEYTEEVPEGLDQIKDLDLE